MVKEVTIMLAVLDIKVMPDDEKARVQLFADAKADVTDEAINELVGRELEMGSSCLTSAGEVAFLKSDGNWNWLGGE